MQGSLKIEFKWPARLLVLLITISCSGLLKTNYYSDPQTSHNLEIDPHFLLTDGSKFSETDISKYDNKISNLRTRTDEDSKNLYAILSAKNSRPDEAEKVWLLLIDNYENEAYLLNYFRLLYILESYDELKAYFKQYIAKKNREQIFLILDRLKKSERNPEKSLLLEVIAEIPDYAKHASSELAEYYFKTGDLESAKNYYEKILNSFAYDTSALESLFMIYIEEEKWRGALTYGKILRTEKYKKLEFIQNLIRTYYQLGEYKDLVSYYEEVSDLVKNDENSIKYYINSKTILNPLWNPMEMKKINQNLKNPDKSLQYYFSDERKKMLRDIFKGH